jgi:hypothetical protein
MRWTADTTSIKPAVPAYKAFYESFTASGNRCSFRRPNGSATRSN